MKLRLVTAAAGASWESVLVHANIHEHHRMGP
jgi:hypothetical protein